jgi:two-component system chemotaxis response regulator CheB
MHDHRRELDMPDHMERARGLVVLAASAGGLDPLLSVVGALGADFPLPIAVVLHRTPHAPSRLAAILQRRTRLAVRDACAGDLLRAGTVYVAPPAQHLVVRPDGTLDCVDGHRERHVLSSANPLLASASAAFDGRVIAVVLSGSGMDATDGVQAVKAGGGTVIVQDRATARFFGMPGAAIATGVVDQVLPVDAIAPCLMRLAGAPIGVAPSTAA